MTRLISTYNTEDNTGNAKVFEDKETFYIEYTDNTGHKFFTEDYTDKTVSEVNKIAEDWAGGYKTLYG